MVVLEAMRKRKSEFDVKVVPGPLTWEPLLLSLSADLTCPPPCGWANCM
jgi:hypothetical protein